MAPRTPVTAPPLQPEVVNLVRSSRDALAGGDETNGRWVNGFAYLPEQAISGGGVISDCSTRKSLYGSSIQVNPLSVEWDPIIAWVGIQCSSLGWRGFDWEGRARRLLAAALPKFVEREFWAGDTAQADSLPNLYLAMPSRSAGVSGNNTGHGPIDLTPTTGAVTMKRAFAILEQVIGDYGVGARGMIHARPEATPNFTGVRREGNLLLTQNDTIVVPGNGYPNIGPGGAPAAAGAVWLYATGITDVRIDQNVSLFPDPRTDSPQFDNEWLGKAMNRGTNLVTVRAEQYASVSWDGQVHFAIQALLET